MWDSLECDEALERPKGYCDNLRVLGRASHKDGAEKVIGLGSIWWIGRGSGEMRAGM